jgi:hypothetical protein
LQNGPESSNNYAELQKQTLKMLDIFHIKSEKITQYNKDLQIRNSELEAKLSDMIMDNLKLAEKISILQVQKLSMTVATPVPQVNSNPDQSNNLKV